MTELLVPVGNKEALDAAVAQGADAIYFGLKSFNARLRSTNFAWNQAQAAVEAVHKLGKKAYITVNTVATQGEVQRLYRFLEYLHRLSADALIVQDTAIIRMVQEFFPDLRLHASTQMNIASSAGANLLGKQGIKRVVLARELGLQEIKAIKQECNIETEVFVHGALCVSESGLCLFSSFLGGKSANRGLCTQACRRLYSVDEVLPNSKGYYFSPLDLQLVDHIEALMDAGVESFKIEGRMKSAEYVGAVTSAYRYLLDNIKKDKKGAIATAKRILSVDFARGKTDYFFGFETSKQGIQKAGEEVLFPLQAGGTGLYLGKIANTAPASKQVQQMYQKTLQTKAKNSPDLVQGMPKTVQMALLTGGTYTPDAGDSIRLHKKDDSKRISYKVHAPFTDGKGRPWVDVPCGFDVGDSVYLLQTKAMTKRYKKILDYDLSQYRKQPRDVLLPILDLTPIKKGDLDFFPKGLYFSISDLKDAFVIKTATTLVPITRLIIELNFQSKKDLLLKNFVLPFAKEQIIITLDPFCPEDTQKELETLLPELFSLGYRTFIANNLSHIPLLKKIKANIIAGPYLYTFNSWAISFLENQNINAFCSPLENSRDNLFATYPQEQRAKVLVTVFCYPVLFRLRFKLPGSYDFTYFFDKEGQAFKVNSTPDGSFVMPEEPFCIVDKVKDLKSAGFEHILIDYTKTKAKKQDIKFIINAMQKAQVIPQTKRFNFKDGFYDPQKMQLYKTKAQIKRTSH